MPLKRFTVIISICTAAVVMLVWTSVPALATPVGYTDYAPFFGELPMPASALDFDSMSSGDTIASGDTVDGITFTYDFGGVQMMVSDLWDTTSPPNFLGTDDGDILQDGDDFDMSFAPSVYAIGMYFITADPMYDNDITLTAGGTSVGLDASDVQSTLTDGSDVFFLGIVDDTNPFTTASITTIGGGYFLYNVDDITTAPVPEPGTLVLVSTALLGTIFWRRRRSG